MLLLLACAPTFAFGDTYPGGFVEPYGQATRSRYSVGQIAAFMPAGRAAFNFPAPYGTRGIRLTQPSDCTGNQDCVNYIGYSYWANMNAHEASNEMLIYVGLSSSRGGTGLQLLRYNKTTEAITLDGPIFGVGTTYRNMDCSAGCYFSGTLPTKLYFIDPGFGGSKQLVRYDVIAKTFETVWDIRDGTLAGCDGVTCPYQIYQPHSSKDDAYHSFTLRDVNGNKLGCLVKKTTAPTQVFFYARVKDFDECMLDKSGRWTVSLEYTASSGDLEPTLNRFFDNTTGAEVNTVTGPLNTLGHAETGYDYIVGADNYYPAPPDRNSTIYYVFPSDRGGAIHYNPSLHVNALQHPTHLNAKPGLPQRLRMVCGSDASTFYSVQNEITCVRMDASGRQLIVAPIMTDPAASGGAWQGAPYALQPKGNIDVSGRYFIWTSNLGGNRLDAFLVKIPADKFDEEFSPEAQASRGTARVEGATLGQAPRGFTLTFFEAVEWLMLLASVVKYRAWILWAILTGYRRAGQAAFQYYWRWKVKRWLREAPLMLEQTFTMEQPIRAQEEIVCRAIHSG